MMWFVMALLCIVMLASAWGIMHTITQMLSGWHGATEGVVIIAVLVAVILGAAAGVNAINGPSGGNGYCGAGPMAWDC